MIVIQYEENGEKVVKELLSVKVKVGELSIVLSGSEREGVHIASVSSGISVEPYTSRSIRIKERYGFVRHKME